MKELDLGLNLIPDGFLNVPSSKHKSLLTISGGKTKDFGLETSGWLHNKNDVSGAFLKFEFRGNGFLEFHIA